MAKKRFTKVNVEVIADKYRQEIDLRYSVGSGRLHKDGLAGLFMTEAQIDEANRDYDETMREIDALWVGF